jgi:hypothetical protein
MVLIHDAGRGDGDVNLQKPYLERKLDGTGKTIVPLLKAAPKLDLRIDGHEPCVLLPRKAPSKRISRGGEEEAF